MPTAIEMYRRAYELDYRKGDGRQAESLYRQIIEQFPYSDEKEYCLVHLERLEKIKQTPGSKKSLSVAQVSGQSNAFNILNFCLILALGAAVAALSYFVWDEHRHNTYNSLINQAAISEKTGDFPRAEFFCKQAQALLPEHPGAYRFLAEMHFLSRQYDLAKAESDKWISACPQDGDAREFKVRVSEAAEKTDGSME